VAQSRLPEAVQLQVKRQERLIWLENWTGKNLVSRFRVSKFQDQKLSALFGNLETSETLNPSI
jgi:hypothetical protein